MKTQILQDRLYDELLLDDLTLTDNEGTRLTSYPVDARSISSNIIENHSYKIDGKTGLVEPIYLDDDEDLRGYVKPVLEEIREYFKEKMGIEVDYFGDLKIRFAKLPPARKTADGKGIEKAFGLYDPETNVMYIDEVLDPENDSEEKHLLEQYMELPSKERVIGEEAIHYIQKKDGTIKQAVERLGDKARDYIEGAASYTADEIFGETNIYNREKAIYRRLVDKYGERDAFLGLADEL